MTSFKSTSNPVYWIELRDGFGFDGNLAPQNRGFVVSIANDFSCIPTCALDAHPETQTLGDSAFQAGDTFKDGTVWNNPESIGSGGVPMAHGLDAMRRF